MIRSFRVRLLLSESESRYIRSAFGHYLSPAMVEQLVETAAELMASCQR